MSLLVMNTTKVMPNFMSKRKEFHDTTFINNRQGNSIPNIKKDHYINVLCNLN